MKIKSTLYAAIALSATAFTSATQAHRAWILPDVTVLSGEAPTVAFDAAVSNEIFNFDHFALSTDSIKAIAPDGSSVVLENPAKARYRSTFDLTLKQQGTYRVFTASEGLRASWETKDGKRGFYPGRGQPYSPEGFEKSVPKNAKNLEITQFSRRMETFVTSGEPSEEILAIAGKGIELKTVSHPNDLYLSEPAKFQLMIDGKPAAGAEVTLVREGSRYRDNQEAITLKTDEKGVFIVNWNGSGRYFLEAEYADTNAKIPATKRMGTYSAVFEVLPD